MSQATCQVPGCQLKHHARGYCTGHYQRVKRHGDPQAGKPLARHVVTDPWSYVVKPNGEAGCWYWGRVRTGYTLVEVNGVVQYVHRYVYELVNGPVPPEQDLDHLCHNADTRCAGGRDCPHRACCNPAHLEPASHADNVLRGRGVAAVNARKTHCIRGHEFSPENTKVEIKRGRPTRVCRACAAIRAKAA